MEIDARRQAPSPELFARLKWSLLFRLTIVSVILLSALGFQLREIHAFFVPNLIAFYITVALSYFITLLSLLAINKIRRPVLFSWLQVGWEVLFASIMIYLTGIWDSLFSFLYVLAIIIASILLFRIGAFISATASSLLYGLQIFGVNYGWIPAFFSPGPAPSLISLTQIFFLNFIAFYASALVASYITEQLRRTGKELKEARIGLDRLEALNEAIVHSINTGLVTIDQKEKIVFLNKAAEKIFGRPAPEVIGIPLDQIFPQAVCQKLASNKGTRVKINYLNPAGQELILECFRQELQHPQEQLSRGLLALADITDIDKMEERLRVADRLAAVGTLAAGIAHEVRNPLAAISGSIELLKKEIDPKSLDGHLMDIVLNEAERLNKLITDFLLYTRPAARGLKQIKIDRLFSNLKEIVKTRTRNVELVLEMKPDMIIYSDPRLIEQIFWNLVNNALDAMPEGGTLLIKGQPEARESRPGIRMNFIDTGVGIPPENLGKIFDPFFTTKEKGTGLGLSTIWRIVEDMGGQISVESSFGQGANFQIWLPAELPDSKKEAAGG